MSFPVALVKPTDSALVLCCAAFGGKADAVPLRDAGLLDVTCVDIDQAKLDEMRPNFPESWKFECRDARIVLQIELLYERKYDVLTCDAWTGHEDLFIPFIPIMLEITKRVLVFSISKPRLDALGIDPTKGEATIKGTTGWLVKRSNHVGGVWFWIVVKEPT